jgi:antibiotic biosynthesis monooxygenase (ABM) superfamily enzyme
VSVTIIFRRRVRPGHEAEYEDWLSGVREGARAMPGFLGVQMIRPADTSTPIYVNVVGFDSYAHLHAWEQSDLDERQARLSPNIVEELEVVRFEGMELWFRPPGTAVRTPSRNKMALVLIPVVMAIVAVVQPILRRLLGSPPMIERIAISSIIQVVLLTYVIMPRVTRLLARWLYPR